MVYRYVHTYKCNLRWGMFSWSMADSSWYILYTSCLFITPSTAYYRRVLNFIQCTESGTEGLMIGMLFTENVPIAGCKVRIHIIYLFASVYLNFTFMHFHLSLYRIHSSWRMQERSFYSGTTTKNGSPYYPLALLDIGA